MWWTRGFQIRTIYIVETDCLCAAFVIKNQNDFILIDIYGIYKAVNQSLPLFLVVHICLLELVEEKGNLFTGQGRVLDLIFCKAFFKVAL